VGVAANVFAVPIRSRLHNVVFFEVRITMSTAVSGHAQRSGSVLEDTLRKLVGKARECNTRLFDSQRVPKTICVHSHLPHRNETLEVCASAILLPDQAGFSVFFILPIVYYVPIGKACDMSRFCKRHVSLQVPFSSKTFTDKIWEKPCFLPYCVANLR
jgi:hypothetical protein